MQIPVITSNSPRKSLSTTDAEIFLLMQDPMTPPNTPAGTVSSRNVQEKSGIVLPISEERKLAPWEQRMIYNEFADAFFVSMEKK